MSKIRPRHSFFSLLTIFVIWVRVFYQQLGAQFAIVVVLKKIPCVERTLLDWLTLEATALSRAYQLLTPISRPELRLEHP
jgi:hypothetical protein